MLDAVTGHELEARINAELMQSVLEITTPVCRNAGDVMRWLTKLRGYVTEIAHEQNTRVGSAGTHPFSLFERQRITAKDRYRALIDQMQYVARRELIFGMHVHVAVDDPEKAIQVVNGLLPHLAPLLAMSASSPFWRGEPTGLASSRQMVFSAFPRSGPPPRFRDYADYAAVVGQLERSGCIADYTHIWWDIRLHPRLGTIEIRICDAVTRVEDAVAIAAYCQALVKQLCERYEAGEEIPSYHRILTSENKWLAARYGLEAPVMDLATAEPEPRPGRPADPAHGRRAPPARARARLRARARGRARDPRPRLVVGPPAADLQREPRHRRGRARDRGRDRGAARLRLVPVDDERPGVRRSRAAPFRGARPARPARSRRRSAHLRRFPELQRKVDAEGLPPGRVERMHERLTLDASVERVRPAAAGGRRPRHGLTSHDRLAHEPVDHRVGQ